MEDRQQAFTPRPGTPPPAIGGGSRYGSPVRRLQSPSRQPSARTVRTRPASPGGGTGADVKVDTRPVTQQGMMSTRTSFQGPGRQILDKSYFVGKLRTRKHELQAEIEKIVEETEHLQKLQSVNVQLEEKQENLSKEISSLKLQLGDYNLLVEKASTGTKIDNIKEQVESLKDKNIKGKEKVEKLFLEHTLKEQEAKELEDKIQILETQLEAKMVKEDPEAKSHFFDLRRENKVMLSELESLECEIRDINHSIKSFEQKLTKSSPVKQKCATLMEHLLSVEAEIERLNVVCVPSKLTPDEAKEALMLKAKEDGEGITKTEEKCRELEKEIKCYKDKIAEADSILLESKGSRAEKLLEMHEKEKKMQEFIDSFENTRATQEKTIQLAQERIVQLLEQISQQTKANGLEKENQEIMKEHERKVEDIEELKKELKYRQGELKKIDEMEANVNDEIASIRDSIARLEEDILKFNNLEDMRTHSEEKCLNLEVEKRTLEEETAGLQEKANALSEEVANIQKILDESVEHSKLRALNERLSSLRQRNRVLKEEVELKERELNYEPVLQNTLLLVGQLNTAIKDSNMH